MDIDVKDWLLEEEDPSVRFFTLTRLLGEAVDSPGARAARLRIADSGPAAAILKGQAEGGYWGNPERFYADKYTGTVWQLLILAELGVPGDDPRIRKACEFVLSVSQNPESGGFSFKTSAKGQGGLDSGTIPCLTGNVVWSLVAFGMLDDPRVRRAIDWICRWQRGDDGASGPPAGPPYDRFPMCWGRHSCFMGVVKTLKALGTIPEEKRSPEQRTQLAELAEFLLIHHIHRRSRNLSEVSKPGWLRLGFPLMYQTDILEILGILTDLGYRDSRMEEALGILRDKGKPDGRWILENSFNGKTRVTIESKGKPSKWITLRALTVLKKISAAG